MDEILEELGVSYDDLYKLHTGHRIHNETDDSSSSDDSESLDGNFKPPLYSVDQIKQNVFIVGEQNQKGDAKNSSNTDKHEEIAKKLSSHITKKYCYICKKNGSGHYKHANHYHKVRRWLQAELPHITGEKLSSFFCESCNLPLDGNGLAQKHYQSDSHKTKVKSFCLPCLRQIPQLNMHEHINSKKHKEDASENLGILQRELMLNLDSPENESMLNMKSESDGSKNNDQSEAQRSRTQDQTYFYGNLEENVLSNEGIKNNDLQTVSVAIVDQSNWEKLRTATEYETLANTIMDLLNTSFCSVCSKRANGPHYNTREHNKALEKWIKKYAESFGFHINKIDDLICFACHAVFPNNTYAEIHYESSKHESKSKRFCKVCLRHLTINQARDHDKQSEHKYEEKIKENERNKTNIQRQTIFPSSEIFIPQQTSNLKIHGIDVNRVKAIIQNKMAIIADCEPIAKTIIQLMTPVYCFICNKSALKNNRGVFRHYTYQTHIGELKELLHIKAKAINSKQTNYEALYCETCNQMFLNFKLAEEHYNTSRHKTYCAMCKMHGVNIHFTPIIYDESSEYGTEILNEKNGYVSADSKDSVIKNTQVNNTENQVSLPTEDDPARVIAQKLQEMLSPIYCFVCKKNVNMHIFHHHYLEREHTAKLRSWLDKEIKKSGVKIDRNILYCEACFLELGGTSADLKHYETASHQFNDKTYCSICIFRGTPNNVVEHTSNQQHIDNLNKLRNNTKENNKYTKWPKKLTKLITLKECKVCCVKLQTTENADFHYCSDMHNINVREWLDNYNQYGDNSITTGNNKSKKFNCVFCDSGFSSEQELNDHNDSHFPTLGGNKGRNTRKNSMNISEKLKTPSEPHKQEGLLQEMTVDQPFQVPQQQITLSEENTKYNENSNTKLGLYLLPQLPGVKHDYTQLHKEIRNEMNKLINTVYFSKTLPLDQSLYYLKKFNKTLLDASATVQGKVVDESSENSCRNDEQTHKIEDKSTGATKKIKLSNPESSHNNEVIKLQFPRNSWTNIAETAERESVKVKLSMELQRLKLVMSNKSKIPTDLALKYLQSLNQLLETSINSESMDFEVEDIFEADNNKLNMTFLSDTKLQSNLEDELAKLSATLLYAKQLEMSLDLIIQFNVQLESLLQYQRGNDILYEDLSD